MPRAVSHEELAEMFLATQGARSWANIAGSFPAAITGLSPDTYEHFFERSEWSTHVEEVNRTGVWNRPIFGDYATKRDLHAIQVPS